MQMRSRRDVGVPSSGISTAWLVDLVVVRDLVTGAEAFFVVVVSARAARFARTDCLPGIFVVSCIVVVCG